MIGEIIAIGDELTSGRIVNTTSSLAARELFLLGHEIRAIHTIGDVPDLIGHTLKTVVARCDFVIVTGGLGATTDDMTNEAVIKALGVAGMVHPGVHANIASRLGRGGDGAGFLARLAWLPEGAEVLDPEYRMAGYLLRHQGKPIWFLPGVPPQMEILLRTKVLPGLQNFDHNHARPARQTVYLTCGLFETEINQRLRPLEEQGLAIGYYPVGCEVHICLTTRPEPSSAGLSLQAADAFIREALGDNLYGMGGATLAAATGCLLEQRGFLLGTAESCTGGLIGFTLTATPGSSRWFKGGVIAYGNDIKERLLGVDPALLARHGAVSGETARAMADGALRLFDCDIAVATTGIAGPDGGTPDKPVGTVYLALATRDTVIDRLCLVTGSRHQIQEKTAQTAVDMVRRALLAR
ncbi:MAG: nicotinamide-nucleotide amidohydrolase family protein [Desulfobulbus sp.]|nr:nicotinamide-nucleotide amidohydrolase family protein [Desulfobulbus sp.]